MRRSKQYLILFTLGVIMLSVLPAAIQAQDTNQVALVVRHGEQDVQTACVEFSEPEITGLELLQRAGFNFEVEVQGLGAAVCSIEQTGCPADDCWCNCKGGGDCVYWSFWNKISGAWQYSQAGSSQFTVQNGDIQGWSWGPGAINAAFPPPDVSFDQVCESSAISDPTATATATSTTTATPTAVVFVPQDTPISSASSGQGGDTRDATPVPTVWASETAPPLPSPTLFIPTPIPVTPTIVPTTELLPAAQNIAPSPTPPAPEELTDGQTTVAIESEPDPTIPVMPEVNPLVDETIEEHPTPEVVAMAAVMEPPPVARVAQIEAKHLLVGTVESKPGLVVVGSAVDVPDLRPAPLNQDQILEDEKQGATSSPLAYSSFGLIIVALGSLLLAASTRRRRRKNG